MTEISGVLNIIALLSGGSGVYFLIMGVLTAALFCFVILSLVEVANLLNKRVD